ncbi:MAG TPA: PorP/SprF family type IX secretion system membrane protein [Prolixibacteraceae bacterium]|nr:PorP/SprF family type IX secretion system membrane protein [Prolixibacteraceae bacterium]
MIKKFIPIILLILIILLFAVRQASGQEFPWLLQYTTNMNSINPAYAGIWDKSGLMVSTRTDWVGFGGAPLKQQVSYYTPVKNQRSGVNLNIQKTNTGREKRLFLTGDYSYQIQLDLNHYLRFGLRAGIINYDNNLTDYQAYPDYIPDPEYSADVRLYYMSVFGIGAMYFNNDYFISLSLPQVINNTFKVNRDIYSSSQEFNSIYLSGGYIFHLAQNVHLRPNLLIIETAGKSVYIDAAMMIFFPRNLQLGVNFSSNGGVCFSGQYSLKNNIKIGYAADYAITQDIRKYQLGTYEFVVGYSFSPNKKKYIKPNYF